MAFDPASAKLVKKKFDPNTAVVVPSLVESGRPPQVPLPKEFGPRPVDISPVDAFKRPVLAAFSEGFAEPRKNDPWGINPENRSFTALDIPYDVARGLLELGESTYGGIKQGTGQLLYNMGASQSSPSVIADRAFEPLEIGLQTSGMNPAGLAPRIASGLTIANRARMGARLPLPTPAALSAEQQAKLDLYNLGKKHGVDLLPADIGGQTLKATTGGFGQTPLAGPQIRSAAMRANQQMGAATGKVALRQGQVVPTVEAGEALKVGAQKYAKVTSQRGGRLYDKAEAMAGDTRINPESAVNELDKEIMTLMEGGQAANSPAIQKLQEYRDRLTRFDEAGGMSFKGVRQVISDLGAEAYSPEMRANNTSRILNNVSRKAQEDLTNSIRQTGNPKTIKALDTANAYWSNRASTIDDVLEPILGEGRSGEDVVSAVESMSRGTKGGSRRLAGVFAAMPPKAADNARATIISRLGAATPGAQNAAGDVFSSSTFLANWNKMKPEGKQALFGNNPVVARHLDDLARLAEARKSTEALGNVSSTGRAVITGQVLKGAAEIGGLAMAGHFTGIGIPTALTAAALDVGAGRLLSSPEFARIVAGAPKTSAAAASAATRARIAKQLLGLGARQAAFQPYINQIAEKISNPAPPPIDYSRGDATSPTLIDPSTVTEGDLAAAGPAPLPQEEVDIPDIALPAAPAMDVLEPVGAQQ